MKSIRSIVGSARNLTLTAALLSALAAPAALACGKITIDAATGEPMTSADLSDALQTLNKAPEVTDATR